VDIRIFFTKAHKQERQFT